MTLRQLYWAWKGRAELEWSIASNIMAEIRNDLRGPDQDPLHPCQLNPMFRGSVPSKGIDLSPDVLLALKPRFQQ